MIYLGFMTNWIFMFAHIYSFRKATKLEYMTPSIMLLALGIGLVITLPFLISVFLKKMYFPSQISKLKREFKNKLNRKHL